METLQDLTQETIRRTVDLMAADNDKIELVIRFKKHLYYKRVFINVIPAKGEMITDCALKYKVDQVVQGYEGTRIWCFRMTRTTFTPDQFGWKPVF